MQFNDADIHDGLKISLECLVNITKDNLIDAVTKGNAAINLANILFEIWDRQHAKEFFDEQIVEIEDEDDEYDPE